MRIKDKIAFYNFESPIKVVCLGDLHIGNPNSRLNNLKDLEKLPENYYFVLVGDLFEMVTKNSVGNLYKQVLAPEEQIEYLDSFVLSKLKNRILGIVGGNHDYRMVKEVGVDPIKILCQKHSIPYSNSFLILDIKLNRASRALKFVIALHHGISGGRGKLPSVRQGEIFEKFIYGIDVYVTGHTHKPSIIPFTHRYYDSKRGTIDYKHGFLVNVPSLLFEDEYSLRKLYEATSLEIPVINLDISFMETKRKKIKVEFL